MNVIKLLSDMVAIPSMNPMGRDVPNDPRYGEHAMVDYIEDFFRKIGIDCQRHEVLQGRDNVIAVVEGKNRKQAVVLEAHTDTVLVDGMEIEPFEPVVKECRLYGRGSCDTKGSLAAMMIAMDKSVKNGKPPQTIILGATADEEYQFSGVRKMIKSIKTDWPNLKATGIVGEPTTLDIVISHKGCRRWRLRTVGEAAHSSTPEEGSNAIYKMAKVINALENYAKELTTLRTHPLVGTPTLSVGIIKGGQTVNTVPELCEIEIDRRTLPCEEIEQVDNELNHYLHDYLGLDFDYELEPFLEDIAMDLKEDERIVRAMRDVIKKVLGNAATVRGVAYGTDASKLTAAGIPCLVCGPGDIANAHRSVEYVELSQLEAAVDIYEAILETEI